MMTTTTPPHVVIRASAGTGKTFQLSNRFIELLHRGAAVDRILATTFTRKAAAEILDRVVVRLAEAAIDGDACGRLNQFIGAGALASELDGTRCANLLRQVVRNLHRIQIGTLDSVFAQMAGSMSLELGLPPGWKIVDELKHAHLRDAAIASMLDSNSGPDLTRLLNLMAKGEVRHSVTELLRQTVDNLYEVYVETDETAWAQIPRPRLLAANEITALLAELEQVELPPGDRFKKARTADIQRFTQQQWLEFLEKGLSGRVQLGQTEYYRTSIPGNAIHIYEKLIAHVRAMLLHELANQTQATYDMIHRFDTAFQQLKFDMGAVRFGDITRRLVEHVTSDGLQRLEFRLDRRIEHILLDEFQDTSSMQWRVLRPFAQRTVGSDAQTGVLDATGDTTLKSTGVPAVEHSFFCVGDGKQAIYGWRGGAAEILEAIDTNLPQLTHQSLTQSFRSSPPVIDTVNAAFARLDRHGNLGDYAAVIRGWCRDFPLHSTARQELDGYVSLCTGPVASGEDELSARLRYAAAHVKRLVETCPGRSVGMLARRNQVVTQLIYELRQLGIPASEEGGNPLTDSAAVETILSVLRCADHPSHTIARAHVARSPLEKTLGMTGAADPDSTYSMAHRIRQQLVEDGYGKTIRNWAQELIPHCGERDRRRLQQMVALSHVYESQATLRPTDFVQFVEQQRISDPTTTDVRVMTVHQAKGLEFDTVVLADLDYEIPGPTPSHVCDRAGPLEPIERVCIYRNQTIQELLPDSLRAAFRVTRDREMLESLCLLYVSVTRAIHALYMIIAPSAEKEKRLRRSAAHLLRAALTDGQTAPPEALLYENGSPTWYQSLPAMPGVKLQPPVDTMKSTKRPIQLASAGAARTCGLDPISPSQLEGGIGLRLSSLLRLNHRDVLRRGTLMHAWFEQITWLEAGLPDDMTLRRIAAPLNTETLDLDEEIDRFRSYLHQPVVREVLCREYYHDMRDGGCRLSVHQEQAVAVRLDDQLLTGTIDRLVLVEDGTQPIAADVIDFKTDVASPSDQTAMESLADHYSPQLAAYCRAVSKMYRLDASRITSRLVFVTAGCVVPLEPISEKSRSSVGRQSGMTRTTLQ